MLSRVLLLACGAAALRLPAAAPDAALSRRSACTFAAGLAAAGLSPLPALAGEKPAAQVRSTADALRKLIDQKESFINGLVVGDASAPQLPPAISMKVVQPLEAKADPEFMEIFIDYAEAMRGARDLVKLAKLTREPVTVSKKEAGKPRQEEVKLYGEVEGSGLASTKEYAERAYQEALGASVALDAMVAALGKN